jgi:hypothetical protein
MLRRVDACAHRFPAVWADAVGKIQPCFGDKEQAGFIDECGRPFGQIKAHSGQSPVPKFQTDVRTHSAFAWVLGKIAGRVRQNVKKQSRVPTQWGRVAFAFHEKFSPNMNSLHASASQPV